MKPNNDFHYRIIKARVAETLIKELFQNCGYTVFEYGMERTVPNIIGKIQDKNEETAIQIRSMPDFVVQNSIHGKLDYLEVKYRKNGQFNFHNLLKDYPYHNAIFVIVSKTDIYAISYKELVKLNQGEALCKLEDYKHFSLDLALVEKYKAYAQAFFSGVE